MILEKQPINNPRPFWYLVFGLILMIGMTIGLANYQSTGAALSTFSTVFLGIFIEAIPFLLLGTLASGLVEVYVNQQLIRRLTPRSPILGAFLGGFLGLLFPVCECGVVPLVRRLYRKGMPVSTGIAFLMAAPVINPIVILSTVTAFGWSKMLWMRIGFSFLIAVITGLVFAFVSSSGEVLKAESISSEDDCGDNGYVCCHQSHEISGRSHIQKLSDVFRTALGELFEMGRYLIMGGLIAAALQAFIPQSILLNVAKGPVLSVLVMMALAVILSICSTVDSFVALGFVGIFSTGSVLSFLLYGPMVDIKSILMFSQVFKPRAVLYLVVLPLVFVLLIGVSLNYFWVF